MANALADETSPYLLQHRDNPVDWLPWGERALTRARELDRPLLVSIGYSACHWCHVMERECFENPEIAALMNEHFVCVKVDREERPDVDAIYMEAVQAMTGHGGWPLNVFITPEQVPFYAGTYFPPEQRHGMPSWPMVLGAVAKAWDEQREDIRAQSRRDGRAAGAARRCSSPASELPGAAALDEAVAHLSASFDAVNGGWGGAPKFPAASAIEFLLRRGERPMALQTLRSMAGGGINDQIGGGFARYAVDATWTVPHFEKMLYDNALLARAYLHGWQVSGDAVLRRTAEETLDWVLREMTGPEGGFYSALDADSEGVEGKFYVWCMDELRARARRRRRRRDPLVRRQRPAATSRARTSSSRAAPEPEPEVRARIRAKLLEARSARVRPGLDDKRLTAWNALMISALAEAGAVLERDDYLDAARRAADFLLETMRDADGRLLRTYNAGQAKLNAYLEDHAFLLEALIALYEATFEPRWFAAARATADTMIERFADPERGGFFQTSSDHEQLVARRKDLDDHPIPSGSSSAALGLLRLAALTGQARYERHALDVLLLVGDVACRHPQGFGHAAAGAGLPPRGDRGGRAGRRRHARARARRARRVSPARRARRRRRHGRRRRRAARGPHAGRRPRRGLRVRALQLPPAGHRARRTRGAARRPLITASRDALEPPAHGLALRSRRRPARPSGSSRWSGWRSSASRSARTSSASSPTPRRTSRPRSCPATPSRRRRWRSPSASRAASSRALVIVYHRDGGLTAADRQRDRARPRRSSTATASSGASPRCRASAARRSRASATPRSSSRRSRATARPTRSSIPSTPCASARATTAAAWRRRSPAAPATRPTRSRSSRASTARCCCRRSLLVLVLLILIYRSPIFWLIPLIAVGFAEIATRALGYGLTELGVTVNGQSSSILSILVLGAGTDYALLLVARYREELRRHADRHEAMALALRTAGPAIFASGLTVIAALLCLALAEVNGTSGLGPDRRARHRRRDARDADAAAGAARDLRPLGVLPVHPALRPVRDDAFATGALAAPGRPHRQAPAQGLGRRRRAAARAVGSGVLNFDDGLTTANSFRDDVEAVEGQKLLDRSFPSGANAPTDIIVRDLLQASAVRSAVAARAGRRVGRAGRVELGHDRACRPSWSPIRTRPRRSS